MVLIDKNYNLTIVNILFDFLHKETDDTVHQFIKIIDLSSDKYISNILNFLKILQ